MTPSRNDIIGDRRPTAEGAQTSHGSISMSNTNKEAQKFPDGFHFFRIPRRDRTDCFNRGRLSEDASRHRRALACHSRAISQALERPHREAQPPNLCLINFYSDDAKLGLHQDRGDSSLDAPVVSISLGDDATFLLGGLSRKDATRRLSLHSGDVVWFGGASWLIFHGVQGIKSGTSLLLDRIGLPDGRINLTLRRIEHSLTCATHPELLTN